MMLFLNIGFLRIENCFLIVKDDFLIFFLFLYFREQKTILENDFLFLK